MKASVVAKALVTFPLTFKQLVHIKSSSAQHYDYHCRSVSMVGGFVYGWNNQFWMPAEEGTLTNESVVDVTVDRNELDTLFKIIEMCDSPTARELREVFNKIRDLMKVCHEKWQMEIYL